jgi:hypothetical protein
VDGEWRVDDDEIILSEGVRLELAPTLNIQGCAPRDRSNDLEALEGADFGAVMRTEMKRPCALGRLRRLRLGLRCAG